MIVSNQSETLVLLDCQYEANGWLYAPLALIRQNAYPQGDYTRLQNLYICGEEGAKAFIGAYIMANADEATLKSNQLVTDVQYLPQG